MPFLSVPPPSTALKRESFTPQVGLSRRMAIESSCMASEPQEERSSHENGQRDGRPSYPPEAFFEEIL